jgi:hypothetical protein
MACKVPIVLDLLGIVHSSQEPFHPLESSSSKQRIHKPVSPVDKQRFDLESSSRFPMRFHVGLGQERFVEDLFCYTEFPRIQ